MVTYFAVLIKHTRIVLTNLFNYDQKRIRSDLRPVNIGTAPKVALVPINLASYMVVSLVVLTKYTRTTFLNPDQYWLKVIRNVLRLTD
jgi:hypothetical protein